MVAYSATKMGWMLASLMLKGDERAVCYKPHSVTEKQKALMKASLLQRALHWALSLDGMMVVSKDQKQVDLMVVCSDRKMVGT